MNGETHRPTNKTPMIYSYGDFIRPYEDIEKFIKELSDLYNKYGIDSKLNMRDFLLAEMSYNFLAVMHNTMLKENEMRDDTNEGKALLYAVEKTAERTKREIIEKAVKWLGDNMFYSINNGIQVDGVCISHFIGKFKQAMEE